MDDAQDGLYNPDKAKAEFTSLRLTLMVKSQSHLDMPVDQTNTTKEVQRVQSFKRSVEENRTNVRYRHQQLQKNDLQSCAYC